MTTGNELADFDREHIWHPFTSLGEEMEQIHVTEGKGLYLHTQDGRKIMDAIGSWWVNLHGHSNPVIAKAIYDQALRLEHVIFAGFTHDPAIQLVKNLLTVLPTNQSRLFFSDNGSTAVEVALKMALQYFYNSNKSKRRIIAVEGAYHGDTFGSMSVGSRSPFTQPFNDFLFEVDFIEVPSDKNIESVLQHFQRVAGSGEVAAFIYEPLVQGANGMVMYKAAHLDLLMEEARKHDIICIADEVFTGFGRTGKWFATHHLSSAPDIMAISKGITGGTLPLGVTSCSPKIVQAFKSRHPLHTFFHGHSYTANPIACAAANASFEILSSEQTWTNIKLIEELHRKFIHAIEGRKGIKDARCLGTILAIEIETGEDTTYFNSIKKKIYSYFLERNILLRPLGNVIYILPPYIITEGELNIIYSAIEEFINELAGKSR
jgi:adenosylmethionine---8-amino-7-oxononanoate aminotransferase